MTSVDQNSIEKYASLKQTIRKNSNTLERLSRQPNFALSEKDLWPAFESLKAVSDEPERADITNNAHIAIQSAFVSKLADQLMSAWRQQPGNPEFGTAVQEIKQGADEVTPIAENSTTDSDVGQEASEFFMVSSYSQVVSLELDEVSKELAKGTDLNKVGTILRSMAEKISESGKILAGWAKTSASSLVKSIEDLLGQVDSGVKQGLASILKKVADGFQRFLTSIIGALFSFIEFVQKIAEKKQFQLNKLTIEIPSVDVTITMVGPVPIPIPKMNTPKLSIEFTPLTAIKTAVPTIPPTGAPVSP